MSVDSVRDRMTMRATIGRNIAIDDSDVLNLEAEAQWSELEDQVPCYCWSDTKRHVENENKDLVVEFFRATFPLSSTFTATDRIEYITNRRGVTLFEGPIRIDEIHTRATHREAALRRVAS